MATDTPQFAATPWPAEDAGSARLAACSGLPGPRAGTAVASAVRHDPLCIMVVHAEGDRLLLLRATMGPEGESVVEEIDPVDLRPLRSSDPLPLGPFWPGGIAALEGGASLVVQGRYAHRLGPDLAVEVQRRLPHDAAYNSFVLLADGTVVTKDLRRPGETPSTISQLDPVTLEDRGEPFELPEPSVARLSGVGDLVVVVGVRALHRLRRNPADGALAPVAEPLRYVTRPDQEFGWDPVIASGHIWWMDNGDHTFIEGFTMLGNGVAPGPVRLWRAPLDSDSSDADALRCVEISGKPGGAITNPPLVDTQRGLVVAFDSANGVLAAFDIESLAPRWSIGLATAQHLMLFPDTGEVIANHFEPGVGDSVVVVDIETGRERCRAPIGSPAQSVVFGAPGTRRDAYYVSLSTIARVEFSD